MSLLYVIDGYNVIHHPQFPRDKRYKSPASLVGLLKTRKLCGSDKNEVIVVFDGYSPAGYNAANEYSVTVLFSQDVSADEKIKRIVENTKNKKALVIVSDDKEIVYFGKLSGALSLGVEEFILPRSGRRDATRSARQKDIKEHELTYSQMDKINKELSGLWLEEKKKPTK